MEDNKEENQPEDAISVEETNNSDAAPSEEAVPDNLNDQPASTEAAIENEQPPAVETVMAPESNMQTPSQPKNKKKIILIITIVAVIVIAGAAAAYLLTKKDSNNTNSSEENVDTDNSQVEKEVSAEEKPIIETSAVSWTGKLKKVEFDTALRKTTEYGESCKTELCEQYEVGTYKDYTIYLINLYADTIDAQPALVLKNSSGYVMPKRNNEAFNQTDMDGNKIFYSPFPDSVTLDDDMKLPGITPKETITYNDVTASVLSYSYDIPTESTLSDSTKITETSDGVIYEKVVGETIKSFSVVLIQPSGTFARYRYSTDILNDDNSVKIDWNDGTSSEEKYDWVVVRYGCGDIDSVSVLDKKYFGDLVESGKVNGQTIYTLKTADHPAMKLAYEQYSGGRTDAISQQAYFDGKNVIFVKNELGYRVMLSNMKYGRAGECGKPVIYLYPEETTKLNVRVGADVTVSEPLYNKNGWDVEARPDGRLVVAGNKYESLFWEGTGFGKYPKIQGGFVVKSAEVEKTLRDHLSRLGLNANESEDFLEFWLSRMPKTPYVRLSWFNTEQMDQLAPLYLSKKPDTTIRIFLDFEGLDRPIKIAPQNLTHPERKGFVLVEWGGLLADNNR